jgi:CspA family cold shock protein
MTFRDTLVTCNECSTEFIFTVETQRQMAKQGQEIEAPELCDKCRRQVKHGGRHHGRIKWFDLGKGYGFIVGDGGEEIFVHRSGVRATDDGTLPTLADGQEVLYEVMDTPKGVQAIEVALYNG